MNIFQLQQLVETQGASRSPRFLKKLIGAAAPIIGTALGGPAGGAIGSALGGALATDDAQDFATNSAATANAFTKEQLQNRHQWEVADLRAAGLNPILSAMKGAPSIGGSAQAVSGANMAQDGAALTNSAAASNQQKLNTQKLEAEIDQLRSNAQAAKAQAVASNTQGVKNLADSNLSRGELEKLTSQMPAIASSARNEKTRQDSFIERVIRPRTKPFFDTVGDFTGAIGNVFRGSANTSTHYKGQ